MVQKPQRKPALGLRQALKRTAMVQFPGQQWAKGLRSTIKNGKLKTVGIGISFQMGTGQSCKRKMQSAASLWQKFSQTKTQIEFGI